MCVCVCVFEHVCARVRVAEKMQLYKTSENVTASIECKSPTHSKHFSEPFTVSFNIHINLRTVYYVLYEVVQC